MHARLICASIAVIAFAGGAALGRSMLSLPEDNLFPALDLSASLSLVKIPATVESFDATSQMLRLSVPRPYPGAARVSMDIAIPQTFANEVAALHEGDHVYAELGREPGPLRLAQLYRPDYAE